MRLIETATLIGSSCSGENFGGACKRAVPKVSAADGKRLRPSRASSSRAASVFARRGAASTTPRRRRRSTRRTAPPAPPALEQPRVKREFLVRQLLNRHDRDGLLVDREVARIGRWPAVLALVAEEGHERRVRVPRSTYGTRVCQPDISDAQINGSKRAQRGFRDEYGPATGERD